ncbi:MAG: hypothetical protein U0T56_03470 [Ferruginibacter sp.]
MKQAKSLVTPYTPAGIINLELSRSRTNVRNILNIWSSSNGDQTNNIRVAKNNTYLDFLFILFYVPFLYFSSIWATKQFHKRSGWANLGNYVTWFCLIAGALDNFGKHRHVAQPARTSQYHNDPLYIFLFTIEMVVGCRYPNLPGIVSVEEILCSAQIRSG